MKHKCSQCKRSFNTPQGLKEHTRVKHDDLIKSLPKDVRRELAEDIGDDMPDGAFFAMAEDTFGLSIDDFIDD